MSVADVVAAYVRDVPDYPKPGVLFKDITPLLADHTAFSTVVDALVERHGGGIDKVVGIEARGFILAAPVAYRCGAGFVPVRKEGKLPGETLTESYDLEYGSATIEIHRDAIVPGERVLVIDDVLATGGTARATVELVRRLGGELTGLAFLLELAFLGGGKRVADLRPDALLTV